MQNFHVFLSKNKYKVLEQNTFWLSENPENQENLGTAYPRIVTYALFENIKPKKKFGY